MKKPRILVVDDDPGMLRATERVLGARYQVVACRTSRDALAQVPAFIPDIALLDVRMPDLSGFELRDVLHEACPHVDVIFMTGSLDQIDATFIRAIRSHAFYFIQKPFDREVLLTLVERCVELRRASSENRRHVSRLEAELDEARTFQQSLLPAGSACIGGLSIASRYLPCVELGGDFCDYAAAGPAQATLLIADVAGHGVSAAMLTGIVKAAFDASRADGYEPRAIVRRIADGVHKFECQRYVTVLCVRIDSARNVLEYVNAGHPPGMLWSAARDLRRLDPTSTFVSSAFPDAAWSQSTMAVSPGDQVLLFTDGVIERAGSDETFGDERILEKIEQYPDGGGALLDAILEAANRFGGASPASDDQALLTARIDPLLRSATQLTAPMRALVP